MPRRDGTGPNGLGAATGRGLGLCVGADAAFEPCRAGFGRRGRGRGFCVAPNATITNVIPEERRREALTRRREVLRSRLADIDRRLDR